MLRSILEETLKSPPSDARRVTCLATRSTPESGLYQKRLDRLGVDCLFLAEWQEEIDSLVSAGKAKGKSGKSERRGATLFTELRA